MGFCFALVASTYGWTHKEILELSARQFFMYVEQIPKLTARQQLNGFEVTGFPNMEMSDKKQILKQYEDILTDGQGIKTPQRQIDDNWDLLRQGIIPNE